MLQNDFSNNTAVVESKLLSPRELLKALKRHPIIFVTIFFAIILIAIAYIVRFVPIYRSTVTIELEPQASSVLGRGAEFYSTNHGSYWANKNYYATQYEIIKSYAVSARVVADLSEDKAENLLHSDSTTDIRAHINTLRGKISVIPQKNSNIARISIDDTDPEFAAFLANELTQAYLDFNIEKKYLATKAAARWLLEQSINLKKQLEKSELAVFAFKKDHRILSTTFEQKKELLSTRMATISQQLTREEMEWKSQKSLLKELQQIDISDVDNFFISDVAKNQGLIQKLKISYLTLMEKYKDKLNYYGEKHPEIISLQDRLSEVKQELLRAISGVRESLSLETRTKYASIKELRGMLLSVQNEMVKLSKLEITHGKLIREVATNKKMYDMVLERTKQADLSKMLKANNIRVIDSAQISSAPIKPRTKIIMLIAILLALLCSTATVLGIELLSHHVSDIEELEQISGKSIIGFIPTMNTPNQDKEVRQLFFDKEAHSPAVEAIRSLRANIHLATLNNNKLTLLVTSTVPKEGKTTVAGNLAIAFVAAGKRVILVDTDLRRPQIHRMFNLKNKQGITSFLLGDNTLDEIIYHTDTYKGLSILPAGPISPTPLEMIGSNPFAQLIEKLKQDYDVVILDSPPLFSVTDATVLSTMVDSTLLISRFEYERKDVLRYTVKTLAGVNAHVLGIVVNGLDPKKQGHYSYGYSYGYNYTDYASQRDDEA